MFNQYIYMRSTQPDASPYYRDLLDGVGVADAAPSNLVAALVLAEVLGHLDAANEGAWELYYKDLSDTATAQDAGTAVKGKFSALSDQTSVRETGAAQVGYAKFSAEVVGVSEIQAAHVGKLVADYVRATESLVCNWDSHHTISDRLTAVDNPAALRAFLCAITEIVTNSEAISSALGFTVSDRVAATDNVAGTWSGIRVLLDTLSALGTISSAKGYGKALADVIALTENPLLLFAVALLAADTLAASDAAEPNKMVNGRLDSALTVTESVTQRADLSGQLVDTVTFDFKVMLDGEVYQCWSFTTGELHPSLFTNYDFTSYANVGAETYATRPDGIYLLGGATDAGAKIETGVKLNFGNMGTHLQKRLYYADFGLVGESPALRVTTATGTADYYVAYGKAKLGMGAQGRDWELTLTDIDALDFVEIAPVILSR